MHWVIDAHQTIIVNEQSDEYTGLSDVEAVIWDWLTLNYAYNDLLRMIDALEQTNAEKLLHTTLQKWVHTGLLTERKT